MIDNYGEKVDSDKIWLDNGLKATITQSDDTIIIDGIDRSFMQKNCEYLIFCDYVGINKCSDKKIYREAEDMWIGCFNISRDCTQAIKTDEAVYNPDIDYYNSDKKTLETYIRLRNEIVKNYGIK